ncbi:hypothetical protein DPX16_9965 [Anabarilius grahami]|uniref:Uncharacterized protein n=1 Tax=Anabarilius grahami TaxID=495550 RepID=A0A3N0XWT6_ANAGA|nr:hypothetical protein DPX16_9965 [Anabarilius grahami]
MCEYEKGHRTSGWRQKMMDEVNKGRRGVRERGSVSDHRGSVISSPNCLFLAWGRLPRQPFPQQLSPLGGRISGNIV